MKRYNITGHISSSRDATDIGLSPRFKVKEDPNGGWVRYKDVLSLEKSVMDMTATLGEHKMGGWIGVDLDGTLAEYGEFKGLYVIGDPIPKMVERVQRWLAEGWEVCIMTATYMACNIIPFHETSPLGCW